MTRWALMLMAVSWVSSALADVAPITPLDAAAEAAALREAEVLGQRLFRHDRAAAVATDELLKVRKFRRNRNLEGWVTEERGDQTVVTFVGRSKDGTTAAFYRVNIDATGSVVGEASILKDPEPLSGFEAAAARARTLGRAAPFQPCAQNYNTVVLPSGSSEDDWQVYLLPGTTEHGIVPIGGTYRVAVNIVSGETHVRPYTRSCIQLQNEPRAVALAITHLLDPVPTEVHVFWSMWAEKAIYLTTPPHGSMWSVQGPKISLVKRGEETPAGKGGGDGS